jgi:hypothetical protein
VVNIKEQSANSNINNVYPNPTNGLFFIAFENTNINGKTLNYQLFDSQGKLVDEEIHTVSDNRITIDKTDLLPGIYHYRVKTNSTILGLGKISIR